MPGADWSCGSCHLCDLECSFKTFVSVVDISQQGYPVVLVHVGPAHGHLLRIDGIYLDADVIGLDGQLPGKAAVDQYKQLDLGRPAERLKGVHGCAYGSAGPQYIIY